METATLPTVPFPSTTVPSSSDPFSPVQSAVQSASEQHFLANGIAADLRSDGRSRLDYRYFQLRSGVVAHAAGSARIQLEGTDVLVAVTADLTPTEWSRPDEGIVQCSVELSASFASITAPSVAALLPSELKAALDSLLVRSRAFDLRQLCLLRGEQCWTLYIDVLVLSADGSLVDATSLATKAALLDTKLPAVAVSTASRTAQQPVEVTLTDQPPTPLQSTERLPVAVTFHSFNRSAHFVLDARGDEEAAADWRLTVGVAEDGRVVVVDKGGSQPATHSITRMMAAATKVGVDLNRLVRKLSQSMDGSSSGANSHSSTQADMSIH